MSAGNRRTTRRGRLLAGIASAALLCAWPGVSQAAFSVSGRVFEDIAGDGLPAGQAANDAVNPGANNGVTVQLYRDNGDASPGAGDVLVSTTATAAGGTYSFAGVAAGTYWIVVNSKQVAPNAGFNAGYAQTDVWAEQTWGPAGALASDGAGGTATRASAGSCYGGRRGGQSDNTAALASAEHVTKVFGNATAITGLDVGFCFNVVCEVRGGDGADDDGAANRTVQGSLRQFLQDARAIAGANAMRFVPDVATNASGNGGNWWRIGVTTLLPVIGDAATTVDGTAYALADGTTLRDTNAGQLGTGGTVGVDALALPAVDRPELELQDVRGTAVLASGFDLTASSATIRRLALYGFGNDLASGLLEGDIVIEPGSSNDLVEWNVIGSTASSFADPGAAVRSAGYHIVGTGTAAGAIVRDNLIGYGGYMGVILNGGVANANWLIQANEIRGNGIGHSNQDGVSIEITSGGCTIQGNLISGSEGNGVDTYNGGGTNTIVDNTITGDGIGTAAGVETPGVRLYGTGNTVDRNVINANYGPGVMVTSASSGNVITRNSISANGTILNKGGAAASGQIGIDLMSAGDAPETGTAPFVTLNDANDADAGGNGLLNFPVLNTANVVNGKLVLTGWARPGSVLELYLAAPDPSGFGEGLTYVLSLTEGGTGAGGNDSYADTDAGSGSYGPGAINGVAQGSDNTNKFAFSFPVPSGVANGSVLSATATQGGQSSEFGGNVMVAWRTIAGDVFEDRNYGGGAGRDSATAGGTGRPGARVELYNGAGAFVSSTTTDAAGHYAFNSLAAGGYTVRVVNDSVSSARAGYVSTLKALQTYRTDASSGTAVAVTDHVGGQNPAVADAGAAGAGAAMNTTTGVFTAGIGGTAQSIAPVTIAGGTIAHVDFGYSFDLLVNRNDGGQGSLRQWILNANALSNAGLAQSGRTAGIEHAIWMLADGTARPGLTAAYASQFTAGVATLALASVLPAVTSPAVLDAQTQPGWTGAPIIELNGAGAGAAANGLTLSGGATTVRGLVIGRFSVNGVAITTAGGDTIAGCRIGTNAGGTAAAANGFHAVKISDVGACVIGGTTPFARNVLSGNTHYGVSVVGASANGNVVQGNFVGLAASGVAAVANEFGIVVEGGASGTVIGGTSAAARNVVSGSTSSGILVQFGGTSGTVIQGNWVGTDSSGTATLPNANNGVVIMAGATATTVGGPVAGAGNVITGSGLHGVEVGDTGTRLNAIEGNSIYGNTGIGIDLGWTGVTPNDGTKNAALANDGMDAPVFTSVVLAARSLTVAGYVGSAPGQAVFANARVEVFVSDNDASGYGEGRTYLGFLTTNASGGFSGTLAAPGLAVGDRVTATATDGANNTSEFGANALVKPLVLVKRAFDLNGVPIPTGAVIAKGAVVKWLIYIDNPGPAVPDVSLRDVLDPAFAYVGGTIRTDDSRPACATGTCTGVEDAAMFAAVNAGASQTDALDGDTVSRSGSTIDAGNQNVANGQLDIAAAKVYAIVFSVRMR